MNVLIVEDETAAYKNMVTALQTIDSTIKIVGNTESEVRRWSGCKTIHNLI